MKESCIVCYLKSLHSNPCMYYAIDPEAPEGEYWKFSEGPSESEEVFELVPCEAHPSESTNLFNEQGKPRCIYTYLFWSRYFM